MVMGRPPKDPSEKKKKIHVAIDPDIFDFLQGEENKSDWINKAARSRYNMRKRIERKRVKAT